MTESSQQLNRLGAAALVAAFIALPSALAGFGWMHSLIPLPVYCFLHLYGQRPATAIIALGVGIAGLTAFFVNAFAPFLFSLSLLPVGVILFRGDLSQEALPRSGAKAVAALAIAWLFIAWLFSLAGGSDPYRELQMGLKQGFAATAALYTDSGKFSAEELKTIKGFIEQLGAMAGRVLPSLLFASAICTVWLNLALGRRFLKGRTETLSTRPELREWRLPELLVWPVIVAGAALLIPNQTVKDAGLNLGVAMLVLYLTQGVAILASLFVKWSLATPLRIILYTLLFFQMYGLVLVAVLGLADVWADFRRPRVKGDTKDATEY